MRRETTNSHGRAGPPAQRQPARQLLRRPPAAAGATGRGRRVGRPSAAAAAPVAAQRHRASGSVVHPARPVSICSRVGVSICVAYVSICSRCFYINVTARLHIDTYATHTPYASQLLSSSRSSVCLRCVSGRTVCLRSLNRAPGTRTFLKGGPKLNSDFQEPKSCQNASLDNPSRRAF